MKRILLTLTLLLGVGTAAFAQKGTTEVSAFFGGISFNNISETPSPKFASFLGGGFELKYNITNALYLTANFNSGWDGDFKSNYPGIRPDGVVVQQSQSRKDFNFVSGVGANFLRSDRWTGYIQLMFGAGVSQIFRHELEENKYTFTTINFTKADYATSSSVGFDYHLNSSWKLGAFYTVRLLGTKDLSHLYGLKVSFVLPK